VFETGDIVMRKSYGIFLIGLLVATVAASVTSVAIVNAQVGEDPYVRVIWEVVDEMRQEQHDDENSQWIFGPQPDVWVGYADNLTSIVENNFNVEVNTSLYVNITMPKSFLGEGNTLDTVHFWGTTWHPRSPIFVLEYNVTSDHWNILSVHYQPGSQEPSQGQFMDLDEAKCEYTETSNTYETVFHITFTEAVVEAVFWTGMQGIDQNGRPVSPSWLSRLQSGSYETPPIALGTVVNPRDFSLPSYYYSEITDLNGDIVHYVSDNDTFVVTVQAGKELGEVLIPFAFFEHHPNYTKSISYDQPVGWPLSMFNRDAANETVVYPDPPGISPTMFLHYNSSGIFVVAGYLDIEFRWNEIEEDVGMWFPYFGIEYNSTLDMSKYFVVNDTLTGYSNGNTTLKWAGYFTNNTNMDNNPFKVGGVIQPDMELSLVEAADGERLTVRPEVDEKETMKLAYKSDFVEAFVLNEYGNLASQANQGDMLNLTMLVHKPGNTLNGSVVFYGGYDVPSSQHWYYNITSEVRNITIQVLGGGGGSNDTHHWKVHVTYQMTLDFVSGLNITKTQFVIQVWQRTDGTLVQDDVILFDSQVNGTLWHVHGFDFEIGDELTVLKVDFSFDETAPSMVLDRSAIFVGFEEHLEVSNGTHSVYAPPSGITFPIRQVSGDTIWSPSNLRLGDIDYFKPAIWSVTEDGAIDLDGNTYTLDDQYFVKRTGRWEDNVTWSVEGMWAIVGFDPTPGENGDEFVSHNWMGVAELNIEFDASEEFYWYHASDVSLVPQAEMDEIRDMLWANETAEVPVPGYDWVAWLTINRTLELTGITGLDSNDWSTTWFSWGTQQTFSVTVSEAQQTWAAFRAEYAGLLLFNDNLENEAPGAPDFVIEDGKLYTDEVSHVVLIDDIASMDIRRPFGSAEDTGDEIVDPETEVTFGISIYDVNVTIYPVRIEHSEGLRGPWAFRESYEGALGLNSTNFDYWITHAEIDEMAFDMHFSVDMVEYDPEDETRWNHAANIKIDQKIGNWTLYDFDQSALDGRSLAVNFFGVLATATRTEYRAGEAPVRDTSSDSVEASYYEYRAANTPFANVTMGGLPYTWGGDGYSILHRDSGSSTVPIGAFSLFYESNTGSTVTDWNVDASMLFMTAGYPHWGGHEVIADPVFVAYTSAHQSVAEQPTTTTTTPPPTTSPTPTPTTQPGPPGQTLYLIVGGIVILIVLALVMARRR
jgi:hypothetical protein